MLASSPPRAPSCVISLHVSLLACFACRSCQTADGSEDLKKGTQLLEVYAVEIQMYTEQRNNKKLKQLYQKALGVKSAIPHPRVQGIIRECGGKMHMHDQNWPEAATDFFEVRTQQQQQRQHAGRMCAQSVGKKAACRGCVALAGPAE
jgi:hypothetical protein